MDSHEWNKVIGGVLGTVLFVLVVHVGSQALYYAPPPAKPAFVIPVAEASTPPAAEKAAPQEALPDFAVAIPAADAMAGAAIAERCAVCHDWTKGGPNKIGPNLYGVVGRPRATQPGFDYSPAMKAKGGVWTYADLYMFLQQPAVFIPGTKMAFAGLPRSQDRLNVIAFVRMQADTPTPLPTPGGGAAAPPTP